MNILNERKKAENWEELVCNKNTNESFTIFHTTIQKHLNDIAPIKTIRIPPKRIIKDEWMTPGLLKCIQKQRNLYKTTLVKQCSKYKNYRNSLTRILRKARETYYQTKCTEFKRNTKKLLQMINRITNRTSNKATLIEYLKVDTIELHNAKEIATEFAKYFSTIG